MATEKLNFCVVKERAVAPMLGIEPYVSPIRCSFHGEAFLVTEHGNTVARVVAHLSIEWKRV
jgi:hypothetical protein